MMKRLASELSLEGQPRAFAGSLMNSSADLVARACEGDQEAFRLIFERYSRPVISSIYDLVSDRELAEELTQETFVRAYRSLRTMREETKLSTWLFGIAKNVALDLTLRGEELGLPEATRNVINTYAVCNVLIPEQIALDSVITKYLDQELDRIETLTISASLKSVLMKKLPLLLSAISLCVITTYAQPTPSASVTPDPPKTNGGDKPTIVLPPEKAQ